MPKRQRDRAPVAMSIIALQLLAGCAQSTPAWGPNSPRNGAGEVVDPTYGTPLPGQTTGYDSM